MDKEKTCRNCRYSFYFEDDDTFKCKGCEKTHEIILVPDKHCCTWYESCKY